MLEKSFTDLITICIPVYNRIDYFVESLESAINQTINCKIIVIDNASQSDFFQKESEKRGVEYYRNRINLGMFGNWNKCAELAQTEFFLILGDDDVLFENYVEEFLKKYNLYNFDIYYTNFCVLYENGLKSTWEKHLRFNGDLLYGSFQGMELLKHGAKQGLSLTSIFAAIKTDIIVKNPFYSEYHGSNDWLWYYTKGSQYNFYGNNIVLGYYRKHDYSDTKLNMFKTYHFSFPIIYHLLYKTLINLNISVEANYAKYRALDQIKETISTDFHRFNLEYFNGNKNIYNLEYRQIIENYLPREVKIFFTFKFLNNILMYVFSSKLISKNVKKSILKKLVNSIKTN